VKENGEIIKRIKLEGDLEEYTVVNCRMHKDPSNFTGKRLGFKPYYGWTSPYRG
jgi:hypothetical protein